MKIVLVHEWLTNLAGSEKVLLQMAETFPDAKIIVGVADPRLVDKLLPARSVRSLLSPTLPGILTRWPRYAPLFLLAWRFCKIEADVVIISSHFGAHQVCHRAIGQTIVYYHTPMRMAWKYEMEKDRLPGPFRTIIRAFLPIIQYFDRLPAQRATRLLANSMETRSRIRDYYGRESSVIHPPVETNTPSTSPSGGEGDYYLCFGRLVEYKRVDDAILACNQLGRQLIIAGTGSHEPYLRKLAGPTIHFLGNVDNQEKDRLLGGARALLFPGLEDFGIVPVEAMSHGTPVIALGKGGVLDSVTAKSGLLYESPGALALADAIQQFELKSFDSLAIKHHAARFDKVHFRKRLLDIVRSTYSEAT